MLAKVADGVEPEHVGEEVLVAKANETEAILIWYVEDLLNLGCGGFVLWQNGSQSRMGSRGHRDEKPKENEKRKDSNHDVDSIVRNSPVLEKARSVSWVVYL